MTRIRNSFAALAVLSAILASPLEAEPADPALPTYQSLDAAFAEWARSNHVPGLVWGVVKDGKLVHVMAYGVQNLDGSQRPVDADTGFRIASMSKAFTAYAILRLRDEGRLRLDDPAARYVPELRKWAPDITVADLLHHSAGFVTDDPWGDRQQPLPEADFTRLLAAGVPRTAPRGTRYEYSNLGYALLGRIITNVTGANYARYIQSRVFDPLGMTTTTYETTQFPAARRALGYRWEDETWREEPTMAHGAFGAMGGITTSANDYAKWLAFLLSGWPATGQGATPARIRTMQYGAGLPQGRPRPGKDAALCRVSVVYGAGLLAGHDCELGQVLFHGGGFPGFGSHMLILPDSGAAVFAFGNKTYAGPSGPVWDAATALFRAGLLKPRAIPVSPAVETAYGYVREIWATGGLKVVWPHAFATNFAMDRDEAHWSRLLAQAKDKAGTCDTSAQPSPTGALSAQFKWKCTNGTISGVFLLAPDHHPRLQYLTVEFSAPEQ